MNMARSMFAISKLIAFPAVVCGAIYWQGSSNLHNINSDTKQLIYVHVFHRHGHKTPGRLIRTNDKPYEDNLWINKLSKQYYNRQKLIETAKTNKVPEYLYHWTHINKKLNGNYLKPLTIPLENGISIDKKSKYVWCGQITETGVNKLHNLGQWLRSRYVNQYSFLPPTYQLSYDENTKLFVRSSNYKRCIFSVDSLLTGLYSNEHRNPGHCIPINVEMQYNHWLSYKAKKCAKYYKARKQLSHIMDEMKYMNDETLNIHNKLVKAYQHINGNSDFKFKSKMISALKCRMYENVDLPKDIDREELIKFVYAKYDLFLDFFKRNDILKLSIGVLINDLMNSMRCDTNKFVISSCHDVTIAPLLWCLLRQCNDKDIVDKAYQWPRYGDCLIFEVWIWNDKRYVRVLQNKDILKINGNEYIELSELEDRCKDLVVTAEQLLTFDCCC